MPCSGNGTEVTTCRGRSVLGEFDFVSIYKYDTSFVVEGTWAVWGSWNICSVTCGTGTRSRARIFSGGMPCAGNASETESCRGES